MECPKCHYPATIKRGWYGKEWQRRKCNNCKKTFIVWEKIRTTYSFDKKKHAVSISMGYGKLALACKVYKVSKNTIYNWRKEVDKYNRTLERKIGYY